MTVENPSPASNNNLSGSAVTSHIEWISVDSVSPNPRDARTHSRKQIREIAASIWTVGFYNPLIVDEATVVLAGAARLPAARLEPRRRGRG
jgi:ParB-like chromosome segregation protein Spo0J